LAIIFKKKPAAPPVPVSVVVDTVDPAKPYTILTALYEWATQSAHKGETLMLVHNETGFGYKVLAYDLKTSIAHLKGDQGQMLKPWISEREVPLYSAVWR
jgi:hypothetical protein